MISFETRKGVCTVEDDRIRVEGEFPSFLLSTFYDRRMVSTVLITYIVVSIILTVINPVNLVFLIPVPIFLGFLYYYRAREFPLRGHQNIEIPFQAIKQFEEPKTYLSDSFFRVKYVVGGETRSIEIVPREWDWEKARHAFSSRNLI